MISEDKKEIKIIALQNILSLKKTAKIKEWIDAFSVFITSNPDHLYNISYYTDRIESFCKTINLFEQKYTFFKSVKDKVSNQIEGKITIPSDMNVTILFDEIFIYRYQAGISEDIEISKDHVWKYRIDSMDNKKCLFRCVISYNNIVIDKLFSIKSKRDVVSFYKIDLMTMLNLAMNKVK